MCVYSLKDLEVLLLILSAFPPPPEFKTLTWVSSYIIEERVCYLTMCDRAYPKKLAFQYLEDLKNEFERVYGNQIETAARPYAFIKFGKLVYFLLLVFAVVFC